MKKMAIIHTYTEHSNMLYIAGGVDYYIKLDEVEKDHIGLLYVDLVSYDYDVKKWYTHIVFRQKNINFIKKLSLIDNSIIKNLLFHNIIYINEKDAVLTNNLLLKVL